MSQSMRHRAWTNLMIAAINAGIDQGLFGLAPDDNRWPGAVPPSHPDWPYETRGALFRFALADAPVLAHVDAIGWGELRIAAAAHPTPEAANWIAAYGSGFLAGEAHARGWLERKDGRWLQVPADFDFRCRARLLPQLAALSITPNGFKPNGRLML
jgi:hypothetical protein